MPKIPKYRIPDREWEDPRLSKDAVDWQRQKTHKPEVPYASVAPRNQSEKLLGQLSLKYSQGLIQKKRAL